MSTDQKCLATAFAERKSFFTNRASAIFPVRLRGDTDFILVFLNYWLLKSNIDQVCLNLRLYDSNGRLCLREALPIKEPHNQISLVERLEKSGWQRDNFDGMLEAEIVSTQNIGFSFPALIGAYRAGKLFSVVHSAGRIKNADEARRQASSEETNWTCKFVRSGQAFSVVPFFHYFAGPGGTQTESLQVNLRAANGEVITTRSIDVSHMPSFGSKLFFIDEVFPDLSSYPLEQGSFVSLRLSAAEVFPRLVVGNIFRERDFLEVTHSFPVSEQTDYCPIDQVDEAGSVFSSMLTAQRQHPLQLTMRVFPTNCPGQAKAHIWEMGKTDTCLIDSGKRLQLDSAPGAAGLEYTVPAEVDFTVFRLYGESIPSRLNTSYRYTVADSQAPFSTDIATGAKSIVYPPKWRHWGHAYLGDGFDTHIYFRNNSHAPHTTKPNAGELRIFGRFGETCIPISMEAESGLVVRVSELVKASDWGSSEGGFLSWMLTMEQPTGEAFWVAYHPDGAIFGEHAF